MQPELAAGVLVADAATTLVGGGMFGALVVAFGYSISVLRSGTERLDRVSAERVAAAELERDRARSEVLEARREADEDLAAARARWVEERRRLEEAHRRDVERLTGDVVYWRARAERAERGTVGNG